MRGVQYFVVIILLNVHVSERKVTTLSIKLQLLRSIREEKRTADS